MPYGAGLNPQLAYFGRNNFANFIKQGIIYDKH